MQADTPPSTADLENLIPADSITNIGHLRVEATGDKGIFRVVADRRAYYGGGRLFEMERPVCPDFDEIREALKRPYAIIPGDYSQAVFRAPIPNFVTMRALAQTLAQRTQCYLLLGQPDKALRELTLMHDLCRILESRQPANRNTLVEAMINVAITGLYVSTIADGFKLHGWQEPQMAALQEQLAEINLTPFVAEALKKEPAASFRDRYKLACDSKIDLRSRQYQGWRMWRLLKNPLCVVLTSPARMDVSKHGQCAVLESEALGRF